MSVIRVNGSTTGNFPTGSDVSADVNLGLHNIGELANVNTTGVANNSILKYDSSTSKFIIATDTDTGIAAVVDDTSPQLGGNLDLNSNNITGTGDISHTGTLTTTGDTGDTPVATFHQVLTGAGGPANFADTVIIKKQHSTSSRGVNLKFMANDGTDDYHLHQIRSRRTSSDVSGKFFQIIESADDNSTGYELTRFKRYFGWTSSNGLSEMQMQGRLNLGPLAADDIPQSNITTVNFDGATAASHNVLTALADFGSDSMSQVNLNFSADATNDAGGGASSPERIGQLQFEYNTAEADNKVSLVSQQYDQTAQGRIDVTGKRVAVSLVPFNLPSFTTTDRNALTANNGDLIYNTTDSKIQAYAGGSWVNLH